jgi:hypothetical protein
VDLRLVPRDEFSVVPDVVGGLNGHSRSPVRINYSGWAACENGE